MTRLFERIIGALLILFVISYSVYQGYRFFHKPIETETVFLYTLPNSLYAQGVAIRDEELISGSGASGTMNYLYEDAQRVSIDDPVVEFYASAVSDGSVRRIREIRREIESLEAAQDTTVNNYANADILSRDLREQLALLSSMSGVQRYGEAVQIKPELTSVINRKQISTGKVADFSARISELEAELRTLEPQAKSSDITTVTAAESGYFSRHADGYERLVTVDMLSTYTMQDYLSLISGSMKPAPTNALGKLVKNQNWMFAISRPVAAESWLRVGQSVTMRFDSLDEVVPGRVVKIIEEQQQENRIVVFSSDYMSEDLINLRLDYVTVSNQQYSGLRVNSYSYRFQGDRRGVYVLDGGKVVFKELDPVYEEASFTLSAVNYFDSKDEVHVRLYDQVITRGNDLYDGKVIRSN